MLVLTGLGTVAVSELALIWPNVLVVVVGLDSTTLIDVLQNSHRMPPPLARPAFALPDRPEEPSSYSFATDGTEIFVTSAYRLFDVVFSDAALNVF